MVNISAIIIGLALSLICFKSFYSLKNQKKKYVFAAVGSFSLLISVGLILIPYLNAVLYCNCYETGSCTINECWSNATVEQVLSIFADIEGSLGALAMVVFFFLSIISFICAFFNKRKLFFISWGCLFFVLSGILFLLRAMIGYTEHPPGC